MCVVNEKNLAVILPSIKVMLNIKMQDVILVLQSHQI